MTEPLSPQAKRMAKLEEIAKIARRFIDQGLWVDGNLLRIKLEDLERDAARSRA